MTRNSSACGALDGNGLLPSGKRLAVQPLVNRNLATGNLLRQRGLTAKEVNGALNGLLGVFHTTDYNPSSLFVKRPASLTVSSCGYSFDGMKYGERLRFARDQAGMSQGKLAEAVGCAQENISKLERGSADGSMYTVQFARALRVNPLWLATGEGSSSLEADPYDALPPKIRAGAQLLSALTKGQQEEFIRALEEKKRLNDEVLAELSKKQNHG